MPVLEAPCRRAGHPAAPPRRPPLASGLKQVSDRRTRPMRTCFLLLNSRSSTHTPNGPQLSSVSTAPPTTPCAAARGHCERTGTQPRSRPCWLTGHLHARHSADLHKVPHRSDTRAHPGSHAARECGRRPCAQQHEQQAAKQPSLPWHASLHQQPCRAALDVSSRHQQPCCTALGTSRRQRCAAR